MEIWLEKLKPVVLEKGDFGNREKPLPIAPFRVFASSPFWCNNESRWFHFQKLWNELVYFWHFERRNWPGFVERSLWISKIIVTNRTFRILALSGLLCEKRKSQVYFSKTFSRKAVDCHSDVDGWNHEAHFESFSTWWKKNHYLHAFTSLNPMHGTK